MLYALSLALIANLKFPKLIWFIIMSTILVLAVVSQWSPEESEFRAQEHVQQ